MVFLLSIKLFVITFIVVRGDLIKFIDEPLNGYVDIGKDHSLTCVVSGLINEELTWHKNGVQLLFEDEDVKLHISKTNNEISIGNITTLAVLNALRSDTGLYQCVVISLESGIILKKSRKAELIVRSFPSPQYPICHQPRADIPLGSTISMSCVSEKVNPPVTLQFIRNSQSLNAGTIKQEIEKFVKFRLKLNATKDDNGAVYECHQYSSFDSSYRKSCSMKPLNIQYKPEIKIQHTNPVLPGRETILFCQTFANPPVSQYRWTLVPPIKDEDIIVDKTGQTLKLVRPLIEQSRTNITCTATNEIGQVSSSVVLTV
ncbi:cell adhesion molecule 3-like [Antedon mediterranea]|uniref:cell adhesion molecule 3-like n=1 Tax=Antedon mediterranea TaxID=105859 RepID=UPI003AF430A3